MNAYNQLKSYTQIAAKTAPPGVLILMLFDKALGSLQTALSGFECQDPRERNETIHNNIRRALEIIRFLKGSLNMEAGGELAMTLQRLYFYFEERLVKSNTKKHRDGVDEVITHLEGLRNAWATMLAAQGDSQGNLGEA
ncbi:MAG TPA: flagellar export chaperone FliS [Candidatus Acidoferrales bacterium]|jgi:flagellar protein FliS|nr:flagellar export chaperone FliS [Candidatus Acidoferrales bacterium]